MTVVFLKLLNMSIAASWLVIAVLLMRLLLRKAPKWVSCLLWGIVALRLLIPFSMQSLFSLIPSAEVIPPDIVTTQTPAIHSGIPQVNSAVNPLFTQRMIREQDSRESILLFASAAWSIGVVLMLLYSLFTFLKLRWQVWVSVLRQKNVYICDNAASPFILGILCPRIYLPSGMDEAHLQYVLAHENAHIKRRDHWWKPLGFLLLSVYWFNPLLWLAYILLCRDIESACDEKVIAGMDNTEKKGYAQALVVCSVHRKAILSCPLAFGEVSVKDRIKGIARYKKPALWLVGVSVLACMLTAACFLTDPVPCTHKYQGEITTNSNCTTKGMQTLTCSLCQHSYTTPVEMLDHPYDAGVTVIEPTCIQEGSRKLTCTACGATKTQTLDKIPHSAGVLTVAKEPNCTQKGKATSACTVCQAIFVAQILDTNDVHDIKQTVTRKATCNAEGAAVNTCTRCAYSETCTIPQLTHTYKLISETVRLTCEDQGETVKRCTVCGHEKQEIESAEEHTWYVDSFGNKICLKCLESTRATNPDYSLLDGVVGNTNPTIPATKWDLGAP